MSCSVIFQIIYVKHGKSQAILEDHLYAKVLGKKLVPLRKVYRFFTKEIVRNFVNKKLTHLNIPMKYISCIILYQTMVQNFSTSTLYFQTYCMQSSTSYSIWTLRLLIICKLFKCPYEIVLKRIEYFTTIIK